LSSAGDKKRFEANFAFGSLMNETTVKESKRLGDRF